MSDVISAFNTSADRFLQSVIQQIPADLACLYSYHGAIGRAEQVASWAPYPVKGGQPDRLQAALERAMPGLEPCLLSADDLDGSGFGSGIAAALLENGDLVGWIALFAVSPHACTAAAAAALLHWTPTAALLVDYYRMRRSQAAAAAIQHAAALMSEHASPQDLITTMREHLCGPHVAMCLMLLYGPVQEDRPHGPFEYLELQGSWLKRHGAGVGLGVRFYLDAYAPLLAELKARRLMTFAHVASLRPHLDPLARAFIRGERIHSLAMAALQTSRRQLGLIVIGTDRFYEFSTSELDNLAAVTEFMAVSSAANLLQQQHDLVQQGRAALLDAMRDGVLMVLPHPVSPSVLTVNDAFSTLFRVQPESAQGQPLPDLFDRMQLPDDLRQELRHQWLNIPMRDPETHRGEFHMMHPDGYPVVIEWYNAPVYQGQRVMGRIFIFHNAAAERAAAALRTNFISWVSHELRTPLTSIQGFADLILQTSRDDLPDVAREYIEIILRSARHLNRVFTDIIEIVRADTGEMKMAFEAAHLPDIVIQAVAALELTYKARGQVVIMELDDNLPPVRLDSIRITQVLNNLLTNAIKYAPPDTEIRIRTRLLLAADDLPGGAPAGIVLPCVLVTVEDDGPGVAQDEVEKVFVPFFRSKEARASKINGTGLGLTIARSIVERHRGKIWVEGRRRGQRGARFMFTLPVDAWP